MTGSSRYGVIRTPGGLSLRFRPRALVVAGAACSSRSRSACC
ncbi:hypothetical protein ACFQHO_35605 [Actinomadura yumaensis]